MEHYLGFPWLLSVPLGFNQINPVQERYCVTYYRLNLGLEIILIEAVR
jgi:hypothetical protein